MGRRFSRTGHRGSSDTGSATCWIGWRHADAPALPTLAPHSARGATQSLLGNSAILRGRGRSEKIAARSIGPTPTTAIETTTSMRTRDMATTRQARSPRRPTSFRLGEEAEVRLKERCRSLGLGRSQLIEMLLTQELGPARVSAADLGRRRPGARLQEIRHLILLARALAAALQGAARRQELSGLQEDLVSLVAEIHKGVRALWQARSKGLAIAIQGHR